MAQSSIHPFLKNESAIQHIEPLPILHRETIPRDYLDIMGHMNIRWYMAIFDEATPTFFSSFGMTPDYFTAKKAGSFALQQFISYIAEVHTGETVAVRARIIERSVKRLHHMFFMINETTNKLAATMEVLSTHADLTIRRTSPYPQHIASQIDTILAEHRQLGWDVPISGAIRP